MFDLGAWRRPWMAFGIASWAASMVVHARAMAGFDHPDVVGWVLFIAIFPVFFVAVVTHPRASLGMRTRLGPLDAMRGAWPPYIVLAIATFAYDVLVWQLHGLHHVAMGHASLGARDGVYERAERDVLRDQHDGALVGARDGVDRDRSGPVTRRMA